eukprot:TRINITY_DN2388_c0_g3_i1.p2 TRINITY_DN2388_c0_g3~~TRINITY_DN2388_c0_g3_i1.p2  ORF type:complete len:292 (+),score=142.97 TRINITY_DN2388_c0_g3_i1:97-876(+)
MTSKRKKPRASSSSRSGSVVSDGSAGAKRQPQNSNNSAGKGDPDAEKLMKEIDTLVREGEAREEEWKGLQKVHDKIQECARASDMTVAEVAAGVVAAETIAESHDRVKAMLASIKSARQKVSSARSQKKKLAALEEHLKHADEHMKKASSQCLELKSQAAADMKRAEEAENDAARANDVLQRLKKQADGFRDEIKQEVEKHAKSKKDSASKAKTSKGSKKRRESSSESSSETRGKRGGRRKSPPRKTTGRKRARSSSSS